MTTSRELSPESVLHQAEAFLTYAGKRGGRWRELWPAWVSGKDLAPADSRAIFRAIQAAVGAPRRAA